jgi:hypothetical protein
VYLDGCFEADIVITRVSPDGSKSVFNIEVDGPSHSLPTKQRLSQRRDQHLQEACGVRIARIPLLKPTGEWLQRGGEYEAAVRRELQRWQLLEMEASRTADSDNADDAEEKPLAASGGITKNSNINEKLLVATGAELSSAACVNYNNNNNNIINNADVAEEKPMAAAGAELSSAVRINNNNNNNDGEIEVLSREDPFLAAATSRKWKVTGKKKYLKEYINKECSTSSSTGRPTRCRPASA